MFNTNLVWHTKSIPEIEEALESSSSAGLSSAEARNRLEKFGPNTLEEKKALSPLKLFLAQFNDFMIWVLLAALVISSVILRETTDALAIGAILILNATLGFRQEFRAEKALMALRQVAAPVALVLRDGQEIEENSINLVPGDVVFLKAGDRVPADSRLVEVAAFFQVDESALTGESHPVAKDVVPLSEKKLPLGEKRNLVYAGTTVTQGRARALVVATGGSTEVGKIAELIQVRDEPTPLQIELKKVGKIIAIAALFVSAFVFVFGLVARGYPAAQLFLIAVSLAVASIPEGLPAIVTMSLAIGVQDMARRHAIIKKLHAVETLGSATFICTDKTGTLTENRMTLTKIITGEDELDIAENRNLESSLVNRLFLVAVLCNDTRFGKDGFLGDPTEIALLQAAENIGINIREAQEKYPRLSEIPFDSERKRMTTIHRIDDRFLALVKGAPEEILARCGRAAGTKDDQQLSDEELAKFQLLNTSLAENGYRVLAFAERELSGLPERIEPDLIEKDLTFLGLTALHDPPREAVPKAVSDCANAGIKVAMITGDHALTAKSIARQIGLDDGERWLTGQELEALSEAELAKDVENISIYARVAPIDKVKIVSALKSRGHTVAMTGDGINDAPALRRADIGIAMGKIGTDVAREASDMVLTDDNFATIVSAVRYGRHIFDNLKKTILFLLSCNISEVLVLVLAMIIPSLPLPLLPIQILWINLVTDGLPALALGVDPLTYEPMKRAPRPRGQGVLSGQAGPLFLQGAAITIGVMFVFAWSLFVFRVKVTEAQTIVFATMVLGQLLHSLNFRSETASVFSRETIKNKYLLAAIAGSIGLQLGIVYLPFMQTIFHTTVLELKDLSLVVIGAIFPLVLVDISKMVLRRKT